MKFRSHTVCRFAVSIFLLDVAVFGVFFEAGDLGEGFAETAFEAAFSVLVGGCTAALARIELPATLLATLLPMTRDAEADMAKSDPERKASAWRAPLCCALCSSKSVLPLGGLEHHDTLLVSECF